jgi:dynein heavy chain
LNKIISKFLLITKFLRFSNSDLYIIPDVADIDTYREFINKLPSIDVPDVFGMHPNANINYQK